jgi:response regulator RpfG family c-di-GMP phosphodiesterase
MKTHSFFKNQIDESFVTNLFHATPLHDTGKVSIPDSILRKSLRLLTPTPLQGPKHWKQ